MQAADARNPSVPAGRILMGNPGIGKSRLLNYILVRLLKEGKQVCLHLQDLYKSMVFADGKCKIYENVETPGKFIDNPNYFHLFDPSEDRGSPHFHLAFFIIAAPPKKVLWNNTIVTLQSLKAQDVSSDNGDGKFLYVPCFNKMEMLLYTREVFDEKIVGFAEKRFRVAGGVARGFFGVTDPEDATTIQRAIEYTDLATAVRELENMNVKDTYQAAGILNLFKIAVPRSDNFNFLHKYGTMTVEYISEAAEDAVIKHLRSLSGKELRRMYLIVSPDSNTPAVNKGINKKKRKVKKRKGGKTK